MRASVFVRPVCLVAFVLTGLSSLGGCSSCSKEKEEQIPSAPIEAKSKEPQLQGNQKRMQAFPKDAGKD